MLRLPLTLTLSANSITLTLTPTLQPNGKRAQYNGGQLRWWTLSDPKRSPNPHQVRVSQAGFPTRMPFVELLDRYALLLPPHVRATVAVSRGGGGGIGGGARGSVMLRRRNSRNEDRERAARTSSPALARKAEELQQAAGELLRHLGFAEEDYMLGRTLVFLRSGALARCEANP